MGFADPDRVRHALAGLDYPAGKQQILEYADLREVDDEVRRLLRALPLGTYENDAEVLRSVPYDEAAREGQDMSERMYQRRHHTKPGLAEHAKDTERPPVQERLEQEEDCPPPAGGCQAPSLPAPPTQ